MPTDRPRSRDAFAAGLPRHPRRRQQPGPRLRRPSAASRCSSPAARGRTSTTSTATNISITSAPGGRSSSATPIRASSGPSRRPCAAAPASAPRPRRKRELAELIIAAVPSIEMVRMVSSGTEASMSAIRLARGFTGRDVIVKFAGCYHGHVDSLLVQAGSSATTLGVPNSPGVPKGCTADTLVLRYNDVAGPGRRLRRATATRSPASSWSRSSATWAWSRRRPEFLSELRRLTEQHGALADLRRGDDRLPPGVRRGAAAVRSRGRT